MRYQALVLCAAAVAACYSNSGYTTAPPPTPIPAPTNLFYELLPSGDPQIPQGLLLQWDVSPDTRTVVYNVYSRNTPGGAWGLRATTTSPAFFEAGLPDIQYTVTASDGVSIESVYSNIVTVDSTAVLPAPLGLVPVSLNQGVQLSWQANARAGANAALFSYYRVYSTDYTVATNVCSANWVLEGTTVSEDFIASGLTNGVSRCFAVSAVSVDGHESQWSDPTYDTPRFDARNVLITARQTTPGTSGFLFFDAGSSSYGEVTSGTLATIDFDVDQHGDGTMWLQPVRTGTGIQGLGPIADLTSIDIAPTSGYATTELQAVIGNGYAFTMTQADGVHYGGLRVTATGTHYVIVDWSYQSAAQNPELNVVSALHGAAETRTGTPGLARNALRMR